MSDIIKEKPLPSARIITLYEFFKKFYPAFQHSDGIYYLLDKDGYEVEPMVFEYDWVIKKYREDTTAKVSYYPDRK